MTKSYRIKQFSELTSVTVRSLHYYDEIGLLKPTGRTEAGYRLYSEKDLLRLQQILILKFLGLSLNVIKSIVLNQNFDIKNSLKIQAEMLFSESEKMNKAGKLIHFLINLLETNKKVDWKTVTKIIEVMQMNQLEQNHWQQKFLNADELSDFQKLVNSRSKEEWDKYHKLWLSLLEEIKQNMHHAPDSKIGQKLAKKWVDVVNEIYGDYPELGEKMWLALKTDAMPKKDFPYTSELLTYIEKATNILKKK